MINDAHDDGTDPAMPPPPGLALTGVPKRRLAYRLLVLCGGLCVLLLGASSVIQVYINAQYEAIETHRERGRKLVLLLASLQDAETGQRGYLLTGDSSYLAPYLAAQRELPGLTGLAGSYGDTLIARKMGELEYSIRRYRTMGDSAALVVVNTDYGRSIMVEFRAEIDRLRAAASRATDENLTSLQRYLSWVTAVRIAAAVVLAILTYVLFAYLRPLLKHLEGVIVSRDREIDQRRRVEQENHQLIVNLTEQNRDLDHFAYIASHDLQEPLRTVNNFVELLREEYSPRLDDQAQEYFAFLQRATDRMRMLIRNLLQFSKIGQGQEVSAVDLNDLLAEVTEAIELSIQEAGATLRVDRLPTVTGYRTELFQLFQNLISNALKFTDPAAPPRINIYATEANDYDRIAVEDNGIGMTEAEQAKIFRMFSRVSDPRTYAGNGIGLAFCRKIAALHGGTLEVDSSPDHGSTFYITLPRIANVEKEIIPHPPG